MVPCLTLACVPSQVTTFPFGWAMIRFKADNPGQAANHHLPFGPWPRH